MAGVPDDLRLSGKGLLRTSTGAPEARRGGRRRKLYHVNAAGKRAVEHTLSTLERMAHGLDVAREAS